MNIIDRSARNLAKYIKDNNPEGPSQEVLTFSLVIVLGTSVSILLSFLICVLTGHVASFLLVLVTFILMRYGSGGLHFKSSLICCFVTIIILTGLSHINVSYWYTGIVINCLSLLLVIIYTPAELRKHHWMNPKLFPFLYVFTILVVASNFFIHNSFISLGLAAQTFTMPPRIQNIILLIERRISDET